MLTLEPIEVVGRTLLRGKTPLVIRGVNYSPLLSFAERDTSPPDAFLQARSHLWERDLPLIARMGANTIRIYNWDANAHVADVSFLDACASHGLNVVLGISNYYLDNPQHAPTIVEAVARHPALLMYAVSNEATRVGAADAPAVYANVARLAKAVRDAEAALGPATAAGDVRPWHPIGVPVTGDLGHLGLMEESGALNTIDVHMFQVYWDQDEAYPPSFFADYAEASSKPLLLSEWGMDSYHNIRGGPFEDETASWLAAEWQQLISPSGSECMTIGGMVFEWMDEPWKAQYSHALGSSCRPPRGGLYSGWGPNAFPDQCGNEAFFGLTELQADESLRLKPAYDSLRRVFSASTAHCGASATNGTGDTDPSETQSTENLVMIIGMVTAGILGAALLLCLRQRVSGAIRSSWQRQSRSSLQRRSQDSWQWESQTSSQRQSRSSCQPQSWLPHHAGAVENTSQQCESQSTSVVPDAKSTASAGVHVLGHRQVSSTSTMCSRERETLAEGGGPAAGSSSAVHQSIREKIAQRKAKLVANGSEMMSSTSSGVCAQQQVHGAPPSSEAAGSSACHKSIREKIAQRKAMLLADGGGQPSFTPQSTAPGDAPGEAVNERLGHVSRTIGSASRGSSVAMKPSRSSEDVTSMMTTPRAPSSRCSAARSSFSKEKVRRQVSRPGNKQSQETGLLYL